MSIVTQLTTEIQNLIGLQSATPVTASVSEPGTADIAIDFVVVDVLSCAFVELRLSVPSLNGSDIKALEAWGQSLCNRITYLLENIGPLEIDAVAKQVLIRSTPPDQQGTGTRFYEIILKSTAAGHFTLSRFESQQGQPGRTRVNMQMTHEVLVKLVNDLIDSIPACPP